jgi:hypothetical protein
MRWQTTDALLLRFCLAEGRSFHNLQFTHLAFYNEIKEETHTVPKETSTLLV